MPIAVAPSGQNGTPTLLGGHPARPAEAHCGASASSAPRRLSCPRHQRHPVFQRRGPADRPRLRREAPARRRDPLRPQLLRLGLQPCPFGIPNSSTGIRPVGFVRPGGRRLREAPPMPKRESAPAHPSRAPSRCRYPRPRPYRFVHAATAVADRGIDSNSFPTYRQRCLCGQARLHRSLATVVALRPAPGRIVAAALLP